MKVHNGYKQMVDLKHILIHHKITATKLKYVVYLRYELEDTNSYNISIISESPRWLLSKGRKNEAKKLIRKMARLNNKDIPKDYFQNQKFEEEDDKVNIPYFIFVLSLLILFVWLFHLSFHILVFCYLKKKQKQNKKHPKSKVFRAFKANVCLFVFFFT